MNMEYLVYVARKFENEIGLFKNDLSGHCENEILLHALLFVLFVEANLLFK